MMIFDKILKFTQKRYLKKLEKIVKEINLLEKKFEKLSDEKIKEKTFEFKQRLKKGETLDQILPEAFATVREASKRTLGQRHFDVQLMGGIALHQGKIVEMKTGEGKTLTATLALYLNSLTEKGVHLVTVNDYLARRDTVWMGQIYHFLGLKVGCLNHEQSFLYDPDYKKPPEEKEKIRDELGYFKVVEDFLRPCHRKEAYLADITYGTNHEFGFDYLRDNLVSDVSEKVQRFNVEKLESENFNYAIVDEADFILIDEARTPLIISSPSPEKEETFYFFAQLAEKLEKGKDYLVDEKKREITWTEKGEEKVISVLKFDPWQKGDFKVIHRLQNALEAKEFFILDRDYVIKDGQIIIVDEFTGRLMPGRRWSHGLHQAVEAKERIRGKKDVRVQTESITLGTITIQNFFKKYKKLAGMTGTAITSAEEFEKVYGLKTVVIPTNKPMIRIDLPDKIFKTEKEKWKAVVEEIKRRHSLGQPILVGTRSIEKNEYLSSLLQKEKIPHQVLNAKHHQREGEIIAQAGRLGAVTVATNMAGRGVDILLGGSPDYEFSQKEREKIIELGGLFVLGTEKHESRRIDNQLRGRSGRQGDPGITQFFISFEDELLRIFGGEKIKKLMESLKIEEGVPIESNFVSKLIDEVQSRIEGFHLDMRLHLLKYDTVFDLQREIFYKLRNKILCFPEKVAKEILKKRNFDLKKYQQKEEEIGKEKMREIEKFLLLTLLDSLWISHIEEIEYLKEVVGLKGYGHLDPLVEFKREGMKMFKKMLEIFEERASEYLFNFEIKKEPEIVFQPKRKISRNDPCPCGKINPKTGKPMKYKKCCYPKYG